MAHEFTSSGVPIDPSVEILGFVHATVFKSTFDGKPWRYAPGILETLAGRILVSQVPVYRFGAKVCGQVFRDYSRHLMAQVVSGTIEQNVSDLPADPAKRIGNKLLEPLLDTPSASAAKMGVLILDTMEVYALECASESVPNYQAWQPVAEAAISELRQGFAIIGPEETAA